MNFWHQSFITHGHESCLIQVIDTGAKPVVIGQGISSNRVHSFYDESIKDIAWGPIPQEVGPAIWSYVFSVKHVH